MALVNSVVRETNKRDNKDKNSEIPNPFSEGSHTKSIPPNFRIEDRKQIIDDTAALRANHMGLQPEVGLGYTKNI